MHQQVARQQRQIGAMKARQDSYYRKLQTVTRRLDAVQQKLNSCKEELHYWRFKSSDVPACIKTTLLGEGPAQGSPINIQEASTTSFRLLYGELEMPAPTCSGTPPENTSECVSLEKATTGAVSVNEAAAVHVPALLGVCKQHELNLNV